MTLRKEMSIAILCGLLLGGGVAAAFRYLPGLSTSQKEIPVSDIPPSPTVAQILDTSLTLDVLLPEQQSLSQSDTVTVSGKTAPDAMVIIASSSNESVVRADSDGSFSAEIVLSEGANELHVIAIHEESTSEKKIIVNYTPDSL